MRLIHTADIHLGRGFPSLPPEAAQRCRHAVREAFRRLIAAAGELDADALLIAGDLFNEEVPSADTVDLVAKQLSSEALGSTEAYIVSGNHDPATAASPYALGRLPSNVRVFGEPEWTRAEILGGRAVLWAFGYARQAEHRNALSELAGLIEDDDRPQIALIHAGSDPGSGDEGTYLPYSRDDIRRLPLHYIALGHAHRRQQVSESPQAWYPGPIEVVDLIDQPERLGALVVDIPDSGPVTVQPHPLGVHTVRSVELEAARCTGHESIRAEVAEALGAETILRLKLTGPRAADSSLDVDALQEELSHDALAVLVEDATILLDDLSAVPGTVKAEFIARIRQLAEAGDDGRRVLDQALLYGVAALEGKRL